MTRTPASKGSTPKRPAKSRASGHEPAPTFYRRILGHLQESGIRFLVGGGYALERHTGIDRHSCDFDVFVLPEDARRVLGYFRSRGYRTELAHRHWLGKIHGPLYYADVIFSSGNGLVRVDREWFDHASPSNLFGRRVLLCPAEEMIWSKAFIMERERFDGADVMHLIRALGEELDWKRLLERFGPFWRVLLGHLVFFGFTYPSERDKVPVWVMRELLRRLGERENESNGRPVCLGTLLSRVQYVPDLAWGYRDGRLSHRIMSARDIARWTASAGVLPRLAEHALSSERRRPARGKRR